MLTDTHAHVWRVGDPGMEWLGREPRFEKIRRDHPMSELLSNMQAADVSDVVLVSSTTTVAENEYLLAAADQHPAVVGVVGWLPLSDPTTTEAGLLEALTGSDRFVGVRYLDGWAPDHGVLLDGRAVQSLRLLDHHELSLDVQIPFESAVSICDAVAAAAPGLKVVIDHMISPVLRDKAAFDAWSVVVAELSTRPNLFVKLSGWTTRHDGVEPHLIRPFFDLLLDRFGPRRLMMGSNWPVSALHRHYTTTVAWTLGLLEDLSEAEASHITTETATIAYRLGEHRNRQASVARR